jgi:protein TonB
MRKNSVKIFTFVAIISLISITSLAMNLSRKEIINRNLFHNVVLNHQLINDLPDDSLKVEEETIYDFAEVEPSFPGGPEALNKWIQANVVYPESALTKNEQGFVYVKFVVNRDGSIEQVSIRKGVSEALDKEALRVVKSMPNWTPGEQEGKPVRVSYTLPISFRLS